MRSLVRSFHILQHEHPSPTPSLQPNVTQIQNSRQEREQGPIPARRAEAAAGVHFQGVEDGGEGHDGGRVRGDPPAVEGLVDVGWFNLCVRWLWSGRWWLLRGRDVARDLRYHAHTYTLYIYVP